MKDKIMTYLKGKNPYVIASLAMVMITVGIIFVLLQGGDTAPAEKSDESISTEQQNFVEESTETFIDSEVQTDVEILPDLELAENEIKETETVEIDGEEDEGGVLETVTSKEDSEKESTGSKTESIPANTPEVETEPSIPEVTVPEPEEQETEETKEDTPIQLEPVPDPEEENTPAEEVHVHSWILNLIIRSRPAATVVS